MFRTGRLLILEKLPNVQNKTLIFVKKGTITEAVTVTVTNIRLL